MNRVQNLISGLLIHTSAKDVIYSPSGQPKSMYKAMKKGGIKILVNIDGNGLVMQSLYSRNLGDTEGHIKGNTEVAQACIKLGYNINWGKDESYHGGRTYVLINMRNPEIRPEHPVYN
jgi:hypothetical protein